jgi:hypothetical protein
VELKQNIIQIVPRRAREPDGIGDYATLLARALLEQAGINSVFLSGTPARTELPRADNWHTVPVLERTASDLVAQLSELCRNAAPVAAVIHVSGYGYEKRGVPFWLLQGLRTWRRTHANCIVLGVFHELFATGRIWNSSFWLSQPQKRITQGIWDLCDGALTTTAPYFEQLVAWRPNMAHMLRTMPVSSNVGEPSLVPAPEERPPNMVVFGQPGTEDKVYREPWGALSASVVETLGIKGIIDIGTRKTAPPRLVGPAPVMTMGQLAPDRVSRDLVSCRFGLLNYDIARLQKSGVFAAYAAHGVIPICIGSQAKPPLGLEEGQHFLRWPPKGMPDLGMMQRKLARWYGDHSTVKHADILASWCHSERRVNRIDDAISA